MIMDGSDAFLKLTVGKNGNALIHVTQKIIQAKKNNKPRLQSNFICFSENAIFCMI